MPAPEGSLEAEVRLRKYPYPYRAMLAICSDLDRTPDRETYLEIARYMNTRETTRMGEGVGLEIGNSIYFDMPPEQFSYWGTDDAGREMVRALIASGHIDCIHSYGDFARSRADAERALDELAKQGCRLEVWVDHSKAPSNFGPDIMVGHGDLADDEAYHADLTLAAGVRYVWRGRTTGVNGQNVPIGLADLFDIRHPVASARTIAKEAVKIRRGRRGDPRWEMYGANQVCRPHTLRDGRAVWEFLRFNPFWGGSGPGGTFSRFADALTQRHLETFIRREAAGVFYTHLGDVGGPGAPYPPPVCEAFKRLAGARDRGDLFVTTTHRLLRYLTVRNHLDYRVMREEDRAVIVLEGVDDPVSGRRAPSAEDVHGLTFTVTLGDVSEVRLASGEAVPVDMHHEEGCDHIMVRWPRLAFPSVQW